MGWTFRPARRALLSALALCLPLFSAGCQSTMLSYDPSSSQTTPVWSWPLQFKEHAFSSFCFDTYACRIRYANRLQQDDDPALLSSSSASLGPDYRKHWAGGHGGIQNFPAPADVTWRSRDGTAHEAHIDIGAIFADERIVHHVARDEIPTWATIQAPSIILEVNDRTINVYMRATVPTWKEQIPGNQYSHFRSDLILVRTYNY